MDLELEKFLRDRIQNNQPSDSSPEPVPDSPDDDTEVVRKPKYGQPRKTKKTTKYTNGMASGIDEAGMVRANNEARSELAAVERGEVPPEHEGASYRTATGAKADKMVRVKLVFKDSKNDMAPAWERKAWQENVKEVG